MALPLNKAFKSIMAAKGVRGIDLAKGLGVNASTISRNIGEGSNPKLSVIEKYAEFIGVKSSEVFLVAEKIKKDDDSEQ